MKEEFKLFVRKKPELIKYVNEGTTTWQKLYEQWSLYGEDEKVWSNYKQDNKNEDSFNLNSFADLIKKIDMNQVQKGINGVQKIIGLLQGFSSKDDNINNKTTYEPRQLFKKFED